MTRDPPRAVKAQLRAEQGFVCAFPGCDNPYLYFHHFDPPWNEEEHHRPEGMIGLCGEHHPKADGGAFTVEQLHEFKRRTLEEAPEVRGRFDWLRHEIMIVAGHIFFVENDVDLEIDGSPVLWFNRDADGYGLLNLRMPQTSPSPRLCIEDNAWIEQGDVVDLICPPGGKSLEASYPNGDYIKVEFLDLGDRSELQKRYPNAPTHLDVPITSVEVALKIPALGVAHDTRSRSRSSASWMLRRNGIGLSIATSGPARQPIEWPGVKVRKPPPRPSTTTRAKRPGKTYGKTKRTKRRRP